MRSVGPISLSAAIAALGACAQTSEQPQLAGQTVRLTVLHTSDIHSRILPYQEQPGLNDRGLGLCSELQPFGGAARLKYLIDRERARSQRVIHLDSGDVFEGAPIFNRFKGQAEMVTMSALRPNAVVIGNHEFDLGAKNIADKFRNYGLGVFPMLAANYIFIDPSDPNGHDLRALTKPYEILNIEGIKIAVIGMGNTSSMTSIMNGGNSLGITPLEPLEALRGYVDALRGEVDLIFVVSHLGLTSANSIELNSAEDTQLVTGYDRFVPPDGVQPSWEVKERLQGGALVRAHVPGIVGIDAIFGGHLHIVLNPPKVLEEEKTKRKVLLVHSGSFAKYFGRLDLMVRIPKIGEAARAEIVSHDYQLLPVTSRIPKVSPGAVAGCNDDSSPTREVEAGIDDVTADRVQCLSLAAALIQLDTCRAADRCRQMAVENSPEACSKACRDARRDCTSVPAPVDRRMLEILDPFVTRLYQTNDLNRPLAYATERIDRFGLSGEDSPLGNLVADAMRFRNRVEAQFSLTNSLGIRTNMQLGTVTTEQLYNIFPFENTITVLYLSGLEVQELFDYSTFRSAERGCQTQVQVSGVSFVMNCAQSRRNQAARIPCQTTRDCADTEFSRMGSSNPVQCRAGTCFKSPTEDIRINGEPLVLTESYKVAVNDFIGRGGSGFEVLRRNTTKVDTKLSLRDALLDFMRLPPDRGGPGRVCGSSHLIEPLPRPVRPWATFNKAASPGVSCASLPSGCTPATGKLVRCEEDEERVRFFCIPNDFKSEDCSAVARVAPIFESFTRAAGTSGPSCSTQLPRTCSGQIHCCEKTLPNGQIRSDFYCIVPYCIDPPETGRIKRIVQ